MNIRDYLHFNKMTCESMAKKLGITGTYMRAIKSGKFIPGKYLSEQIEIITGGKVTIEELRGKDAR